MPCRPCDMDPKTLSPSQPVVWAILALLATTFATDIHLENSSGVASVCRGTTAFIVCTTTTSKGFLMWQNGRGDSFCFNGVASVNDNDTLGSTTLTLNSIKNVSSARVYISTASDKILEKSFFACSDGDKQPNITIITKSPSSPSWTRLACKFSQGSAQLSWNPPIVSPECCDNYTVQLSTGNESMSTNTTNINVSIEKKPITATVYCIDHLGDNTTSQDIIIDSSTTLEVTIVLLNSSCDTNTTYNISFLATSPPIGGVCTPPITMSTITCTTSSTHQSSNNTRSMMCSVPATEIITATVNITNAAGFNTSQSACADTLAQTCQRLNRCISSSTPSQSQSPPPSQSPPSQSPPPPSQPPPPSPSQLSQAGIAAIIMGLLVILLTVVSIVLTAYIVWNCIRPPLMKESSNAVNLRAVTETAQEKESRIDE